MSVGPKNKCPRVWDVHMDASTPNPTIHQITFCGPSLIVVRAS